MLFSRQSIERGNPSLLLEIWIILFIVEILAACIENQLQRLLLIIQKSLFLLLDILCCDSGNIVAQHAKLPAVDLRHKVLPCREELACLHKEPTHVEA
mmetsp:Transcript_42787/g.68903  ORF Transcript_42787/g.68903 Transcript_42787/m.68903 type:complete len:98 (-) Transcript_42787:582-875(-)